MDKHGEHLRIIWHEQQTYSDSVAEQEAEVAHVLAYEQSPCIILTEHPPLFSIGTSGHQHDILRQNIDGEHIDVFTTGRGGEVTYHGPGQLLVYAIIDLRKEQDVHKHVWRLEAMMIDTLADFDIHAERSKRGIGVWVEDKKIAAVGVRCRKWISYHGVALNIAPNLKHFSGIVPCGMCDAPVTSMQYLGVQTDRFQVEQRLLPHARSLFSSPVA